VVTPKPAPSDKKKGMSTGAIVGIIIAIVLIILLVVDLFCCFFNHCGFSHCCVETFCTSKSTKYKPTDTKDEPEAEELKPLVFNDKRFLFFVFEIFSPHPRWTLRLGIYATNVPYFSYKLLKAKLHTQEIKFDTHTLYHVRNLN